MRREGILNLGKNFLRCSIPFVIHLSRQFRSRWLPSANRSTLDREQTHMDRWNEVVTWLISGYQPISGSMFCLRVFPPEFYLLASIIWSRFNILPSSSLYFQLKREIVDNHRVILFCELREREIPSRKMIQKAKIIHSKIWKINNRFVRDFRHWIVFICHKEIFLF